MTARRLPNDVISCEEAAAAKKIPLANELKTLVITTGVRVYALHVSGSKCASFRKVKNFLGVPQASMLAPEKLWKMGLIAGTVCPILEPIWSLPQLISRSVLEMSFVSTNNGTRSGYFEFDPHVLLSASSVAVDDFEAY